MKRTIARMAIIGVVSCWIFSGCNMPPEPPKTAEGQTVRVLTVRADDPAEVAGAAAMEAARIDYRFRLQVLQAYYKGVGNIDKLTWAKREIKNLDRAQTFQWSGLPEIVPPKGESLEDANEHLLVEYAIGSRRTFKGTIDELVELYDRKGEQLKARLVRNVKARLDPVRTYMYFLGAEIPGPELRPKDLIPAADALYGKAMKLYSEGKPLPLVTDYPKQRKALMLLLKLVRQYPRSDKIALSAYFIAEIYKEYFDENVRAVHWYERAWQWDGDIAQPARFQAATIYDLRMHDVDNAIRCYKLSAQHDPPRLANRGTSLRRIRELTEQMQRP